MKRSNPPDQFDLFSSIPAPPAMATLQHQHDELVELLGRLLWDVVQGPIQQVNKENVHEQD